PGDKIQRTSAPGFRSGPVRLPGELFLRGMIRTYIDMLGLDPEMVQLEFIYRYGGRRSAGEAVDDLHDPRRKPVLWDAQLGPLAGFFLITGLILVLLWPEKDRDIQRMVPGIAAGGAGIRKDRVEAEAVLDEWFDADVTLVREAPVPEDVQTIRTDRNAVRIEVRSATWVRVQDMVTGAEELTGLFPGESIRCEIHDETMLWIQRPGAVRLVDPSTGRGLIDPVPGVIRFIPGGNRYIIPENPVTIHQGGTDGQHAS
ncbi:MAG TPA: hypothetical protein PLV45_11590, partial [bacterium]|nr:hypothetical protein [bacterium]